MTVYQVHTAEDIKQLLQYITANLQKPSQYTVEKILLSLKASKCFIDIVKSKQGNIEGFSLYYYHYSTWTGRTIVVRHLFGPETAKSLLIESILIKARKEKLPRLDFFTNEEGCKKFLVSKGFKNISIEEEWDVFSLKI